MKSHEKDVKLGEGLEMGAVHTAHKKMKAKDAKETKGLQMSAQMNHERREMGGSHADGDNDQV